MRSPSLTLQAFLSQELPTPPSLLITFDPSTHITTPSTPVPKAATAPTPTFSLSHACLRTHVPGARYMAVALDVDAPSPSLQLASPILHYLHTDLTAVTSPFATTPSSSAPVFKTDTATDTWVALEPSSTAAGGARGALEAPLAPWVAPRPPAWSAPHRYVFLVWEQPEGMSGEKVRAKLGMSAGKGAVGVWGRSRWDVEGL